MPDYPKILLKFHCDQKVEEMPLVENGSQRYCEQCNRNLIDFRNHSMDAIQEYKRNRKGEKFCGIFPSHYVQPEILIQPRKESPKSLFSNSLMVLAALSLLTACQNKEEDRTLGEPAFDDDKMEQSDSSGTSDANSQDKKECTNDSTKNPIPPKVKIIGDMMPEPPTVGYEEEPEPPLPPEKIIPEQETIYDYVEKMPEFPGGEVKLVAYLKNEIRYPEFAKEENLEGTVYIKFVVNENGDIVNPVILKTPNKVFDEPSLSVIHRMPRWIPGEQRGKKVKVYIAIPIRYSLNK